MDANTFKFKVVKHGPIRECRVYGPVDSLTCNDFQRAMDKLGHHHGERILLDGQGLDYINSKGIGCVAALHKRTLLNNGHLALCGISDRILKTLELLGLQDRLHIFHNPEEARAYLKQDTTPRPGE